MHKTFKIFLSVAMMFSFVPVRSLPVLASEADLRWSESREEEIRAKQTRIDELKAKIEVLTRQIEEERKTALSSQEKIWKEYKQGLESERASLKEQLTTIENREQLFEAELNKRRQQDELRIQEKSDSIKNMISQVDFLGKQIEQDKKSYEEQYKAVKAAETQNIRGGSNAGVSGSSPSLSGESRELQNGSVNISEPRPAGTAPKLRSEGREEYYIEISDVLGIDVWRVPDLTRDVMVRPDGRISLPIVGDIDAAGLTLTQLRDTLAKKFSEYVMNPQVSISVRQFGGRKFIAMGEVRGPGVYRFQQDISLLEAIALTGGFMPGAKKGRVMIIRGDIRKDPQVKIINANMENLLKKGMLTENIEVKPNDIIYVTKDFLTDYREVIDNLISPTLQTGTEFLVFRSAVRSAQDRRN